MNRKRRLIKRYGKQLSAETFNSVALAELALAVLPFSIVFMSSSHLYLYHAESRHCLRKLHTSAPAVPITSPCLYQHSDRLLFPCALPLFSCIVQLLGSVASPSSFSPNLSLDNSITL